MKKVFVFLVIGMILLMASGVFAESVGLSKNVKDLVKNVIEKNGIKTEDISNIKQVDFEDLPEQIDLKNIDDTNLAIYQIDDRENKPVFVITLSDENAKKISETSKESNLFLNFGFENEKTGSGFLKTATGVETNLEKGYVMMRKGSITGISTNLEIINGNKLENVEIIIYKNGKEIGFGNTLNADAGVKKDYDVQSKGTVTFEKGDIISAYVKTSEGVVWKDAITLVEITNIN